MPVTQIFNNRKIAALYEVLDRLEVGIVLKGWEVKSMKAGHVNMSGAFVAYAPAGELWLRDAIISPWRTAGDVPQEEQGRPKKLLASKGQIERLGRQAQQPGHTLVPLEGYINEKGLIKLVVALVRGKKKFERKQQVKERDMQRQVERELKDHGF